jgi:hypothetical protein
VYVVGSIGILHFDGSKLEKVGPSASFWKVTGSRGLVVASGIGQAYFENGYWHLVVNPGNRIVDLATARDGTIMSLSTPDNYGTIAVQYLSGTQ